MTNSAGFLLDSMFDFAEHLNEIKLKDEEIGLFSALVVIASGQLSSPLTSTQLSQ